MSVSKLRLRNTANMLFKASAASYGPAEYCRFKTLQTATCMTWVRSSIVESRGEPQEEPFESTFLIAVGFESETGDR